MGREVRRVPANWQHPTIERYGRTDKQPMYDERFDSRFAEWLADFDRIRAGNLNDFERECYPLGLADWLNDERAPDPAYFRPWADEEATWFQVWETVSEGTPVTPPFATPEELVEYLVKHGDEWDQSRGTGGWKRSSAEAFVKQGWAPSMMVSVGSGGAVIQEPRDTTA